MVEGERISVILPVYNGARFLAEAIRSVLDQTLPPDEVIVVDDGSTDDSAQIVADLAATAAVPIRYVYQENRGPAAARNTGLRLAQGALIAFQDADDVWASDRLRLQTQILNRRPAVSLVLGRTCFFFDVTAPQLAHADDATVPRWFLGMHCGVYRCEAFASVGDFDISLRIHDDVDWFRRVVAAGLGVYAHDDVVLFHRRHANNLTNDRATAEAALFRMLRRGKRDYMLNGDSLLAALTGQAASHLSDGRSR
jgi:glycosyltransferase involved in cell wall biosynthesis